ncbi:T9SS type A sorting domain-containing protein [Flavobacterium sufflavum]|uniref:T9SS type A sorting domain-containing protein n=1 Tax=Flavobacterium sufflavum TaxID=1921138 RepID=UPI0013E8D22A|nr:T9SS type A sorting domain-containing protein [Flavobacterium sufflavum]
MNKIYFLFFVPMRMLEATHFSLLMFFLISIFSYSQTTKTFSSSGTLELPAGVTSLSVQCWGAGAGGGGSNNTLSAAGGGGGGAFKQGTVTVGVDKDNVKVAYIVGAGGAGGSTTNINGSAGGVSVFSTVSANGGAGGQGGTSLIQYGTGGTGGAAGDYKGGNGANAYLLAGSVIPLVLEANNGGGGGSSAGTASNGNNASGKNGGVAVTNGGAGGAGNSHNVIDILLSPDNPGSPGSSPGGGGGGGVGVGVVNGVVGGLINGNVAASNGGNGGNGQIKATYTCPTYSVSNVSSTTACNTFGTATVTLTSSAAGLPIGTYTVTYDRTVPSASGLMATMVVETAGTGSFTAAGLTTVGTSRITIKSLTSVDCSTSISNQYADLTVGTVPVQPGVISGYTNQCAGNTSQTYSIASVANATSYIWTVDSASGWAITTGQNSNSITVTVGNAAANVSVVAVNSCGNSTASTLAVSLNLPAPTASVTLQPTCAVNTGTITFTAPATGVGMSYSINGVDYSNTTGVFTLVPIGSYNVTAKYPSGCVSNVAVVSMQSSVITRTWNGSWDTVPTIENKVVFAANYNNVDADIEACSCQVNSGAYVTIKSGRYLKLRNELVVDANGSLTFENNASLVQMNNESVNSGEIIYKRYTKPVKRYDFTYWSSPVIGESLYDVSPFTLGDKYYSYDPSLGWQIHYSGNKIMLPGEGYIIRAPQTFSITSATIDYNPKFEGKPNNGEIKKNLTGNLVHLLGNPYPSAMSADAFLSENASKLEGTLYFWTHNSPPSENVDPYGDANTKYNYTTNDYATYNRTGGVGTAAVTDSDTNDNNNLSVPNGKIAAAQGFFAPASVTGGEIVFKNEMRLLSGVVMDNSQFFKSGAVSKSANEVEKNRLWLNLTNAQGAFKQTLIGYITGATNEYEGSFDGVSYDGNQYVDFYSVNQELNLSIQGRALPFQKKDSIALGYKSAIVGEFKISIDHADGVLASQKVFLEDKLLGVLYDLKEPYFFTTEKGIFNDRFVLRYQDKTAVIEDDTDVPDVDVSVEGVLISTNDKIITINIADDVISAVYVYDLSGEIVYSDTAVNATGAIIGDLSVGHPVLIVQVVLKNGKKASKKIIY